MWYDNLARGLIEDETLSGMIERREIYGVTSNPSIFQKAIAESHDYDDDLRTMSWAGISPEDMFYQLAIQDIQDIADLFRGYYDATGGEDGFVSLEVNPNLAHDTQATIDEASWLWQEVARPNLMVKIPATKAGLPAITEAIARGVNVNVTLIFSRKRYVEVMSAYLAGLEKRLEQGKDISEIASVASFFVSRLETKADERLRRIVDEGGEMTAQAENLIGKMAVANTRLAYQEYEEFFSSKRFQKIAEAGGKKQRPLWASTSTKDPAYVDIKYVEELVAENTVNTVPPETLEAYLDHGEPEIRIYHHLDEARANFRQLAEIGISIDEITQELEDEGVEKFADSFNGLLETIKQRREEFIAELGQLSGGVKTELDTFKNNKILQRINQNDPTLWTETSEGKELVQKRLGWLDLPFRSQILIKELESFVSSCRQDGIEKVLLLGMGGSSLAPETMSLILSPETQGLSLKILDSTVPAQIKTAEKWVEFDKTLFIIASKSGTTTETLSLFDYFWHRAEKELGDHQNAHFVAITDPGSPLAELGNQRGFRRVFTANPNLGGRFSALSLFGLVPAALIGVDLVDFLSSANLVMSSDLLSNKLEGNLSALLGILIGVGERNRVDKLTILADETLAPLGAWLEQLVAESSGKEGRGILPVVDEPVASVEHYSFDRIFIYLRSDGGRDAFADALRQAGFPLVVINSSSHEALSEAFYRWELVIAFACQVIGVNAFDQPNVQDSKNRTKKRLNFYLENGHLEDPDLICRIGDTQLYGADFGSISQCGSISEVIKQFTSLAEEGDYIALNAYLPREASVQKRLNQLRERILKQTGRATTLGFGPRFLHSTGQLHKGGPNNGLFIQITQDDREDIEIPGQDCTFGILARAQANGDLEALLAQDRRAIRIHLQADDPLNFE